MRNITVAVSDTAYRDARVWAARHDTSISAAVQYLIERLPRLPIAQRGFPVPNPDSAVVNSVAKVAPKADIPADPS